MRRGYSLSTPGLGSSTVGLSELSALLKKDESPTLLGCFPRPRGESGCVSSWSGIPVDLPVTEFFLGVLTYCNERSTRNEKSGTWVS